MRAESRRSLIWIVTLGLAACVCEVGRLDLLLQDRFFDPVSRRWIVDGQAPVGRWLFYDGPKVVLVLVAAGLLAALAGPAAWRRGLTERGWHGSRIRLAAALLAAALVPASAGALKSASGVFCPSELVRYGGTAPYRRPYAMERCNSAAQGHCWPAGHASGGFALLAFRLLAGDPQRRRLVTGLALGAGWWMGGYQMLKGAHFISHTLVTLSLSVAIAAIAERFFALDHGEAPRSRLHPIAASPRARSQV